ncbi:helix-turn-helix transcriptional regulator [Pararhizobium sp. O133]|uniref:helix-turn-helix transcriptional regulator n=1 Tax=Pararhizobium sp. O133 TaxID=3449278 RepID=UPI003F688FC5
MQTNTWRPKMKNFRTPQAAAYLGVSKSLLDKLRCYGGGPIYAKLGSSVIYSAADLDAWISSKRVTARPALAA